MINEPHIAIKVVRDEAAALGLLEIARQRGAAVIGLDLVDTENLADLERGLITTFGIPVPCVGFDAIVSLAADVDEWIPSGDGYLLIVRGLDASPSDVTKMAVGVLPSILDRLRSGGVSFEAVLIASTSRALVEAELRTENTRLDKFGKHPWTVSNTGPVPVYVDGRLDTPFT